MMVKAVIIPSREKRPCRRMCKAVFLLDKENHRLSRWKVKLKL